MTERRIITSRKYYVNQFQADINNLKRTIDETIDYFDRTFIHMDEDTRLELRVVINELLVNAVKHGCKIDSVSSVKVVAGMLTDDCALLIVEDDGDGYDTAFLSGSRNRKAFERDFCNVEETGRGINIVKKLCEDFMVNEKGNKVVINKKLRRAKAV